MKRLVLFPLLFVLFVSMACIIGGNKPKPTPTTEATVAEIVEQPTDTEAAPTDTEAAPTDTAVAPVADTPTAEALPTDTEAPQPTAAQPTAALATATPAASGGDYFKETFSGSDHSNLSQWVVAGDKTKDFASIEAGHLKFELPSAETYSYVADKNHTYSDVYVETKFQPISGGRNGIAVLCRVSSTSWYELRIATRGQYSGTYEVYRYDEGQRALHKNPYINLIKNDREYSTDIKPGYVDNTIGMSCIGNEIHLFINGVEQVKHGKKIVDDNLTSGLVGIGAMSFSNGPIRIDFAYLGTGK